MKAKQPITARLMISLYGVLMSSVSLACLAAVPLMPIGDLIVLFFTTPVFAVFFELLLLKRPIKFFTLGLCCLIGERLIKRTLYREIHNLQSWGTFSWCSPPSYFPPLRTTPAPAVVVV